MNKKEKSSYSGMLEIGEEDIDKAVERAKSGEFERIMADKSEKPAKNQLDSSALELKSMVNDFLNGQKLEGSEKHALKSLILGKIKGAESVRAIKEFIEMEKDLERIIKNIAIIKTMTGGTETIKNLIKTGKIDKLLIDGSAEINNLMENYGPGLR